MSICSKYQTQWVKNIFQTHALITINRVVLLIKVHNRTKRQIDLQVTFEKRFL